MSSAPRIVSAGPLREFCKSLFGALGMPESDAAIQSEVLVWANLRGVDSHGVLRVPRYAEWLRDGQMNPEPVFTTVSNTSACRVIDADRASGAVAMMRAMNDAVDIAHTTGIGWVIVRKTTHAGPAGYFTRFAAERSMAGISIVTSRPNMAWHGAGAAGVATSPVAIAVPGPDGPLMLDMATSSIAVGAIKQARATGRALPENVALTSAGEPTRDPQQAAIPLPLGGPKGAGLALLFECLLGVLVEYPLLAPALSGEPTQHAQNGLCAAIDIAAFTQPHDYERRIGELAEAIKSLPAVSPDTEIQLPGERGDRTYRQRKSDGIPIPNAVWDQLASVADSLNVPLPAATLKN